MVIERQNLKPLRKNIEILLFFIIIVLTAGCVDSVSVNFVQREINFSKSANNPITQTFIIESTYPGAQFVDVEITTNDERIVLAKDLERNFQPSLSYPVELGKEYPRNYSFSFKVSDKNIPNGKYYITAKIMGAESKDSSTKSFNVKIVD
ncbi:MAG: hypothetical protein V3T58_01530 [Candidatus Hydrothermarchaeales archaeon]